MQIPPLGTLIKDEENDWLISDAFNIAAFNNTPCEFLIEGYETDPHPQDFSDAISNFITLNSAALKTAETPVFNYYLDWARLAKAEGLPCVEITSPEEIWQHIQFGHEALVCRRNNGDRAVYVLFECDCDWNQEDGLQIVFKHGNQVSKVGPFDDFLSNEDVYGLPELDKVIYQSPG